jgi:hypothetical protein
MGELTREQIAICRISDGAVLNKKKPSLINKANDKGGIDNISVILIEYG